MKPVVLLVEPIHPKYLALLEKSTRVVRPSAFDEDTLARTAAEHQVDAIVIRTKGSVTRKIIHASPRLKIVGRHGIGVDHIDIDAATKAGVWVVNTPAGSITAVTEHTWMMILALAKHAIGGDAATRQREYQFRDKNKSLELRGKTLGIIGLGRIGTRVAEAGVRGFGMKLLYTDIVRYTAKERRLGARKVSLKTLLSQSDVVSIHTPLDKSTRGMIGARELKWMQPHALLINCARGAIVDTVAVARALKARKLGGAGIDVFDPEIPPASHPLLKCENAILSPHSAAQTPEANLNYGAVVLDVLRVLQRKRPKFPLNVV
ncbi:MAG TPA: hydroxyacid dehydrogenase [Planctomycetota bacterium]|nr:hydroxyacid dehydrogenase [Planctomycetota bacterium]